MSLSKQPANPLLRKLVASPYLDLIGAVLVLGVCVVRDFHETIFFQNEIQFGVPFSELLSYIGRGAYPLGILSTIGAIFSLLATRLVGRQRNLGNIFGVVTTINSGWNDFLFGNGSAAITYPVTFFLHTFAVARWAQGERIRKRDRRYYYIVGVGLLLGFALVFLGAKIFGGRLDLGFLSVVSLTFGLSLGANFANALKYEETWLSWIVYNIVQLIKNLMLANLANVVKYIFYLFNAGITLGDWKLNGDR